MNQSAGVDLVARGRVSSTLRPITGLYPASEPLEAP
jgi:hypothetical protein